MKKRIFTAVLIGTLCISNVFPVLADEIIDEDLLSKDDLSTEMIPEPNEDGLIVEEESNTNFGSGNTQQDEYGASDNSTKNTQYTIKFFGNGSTSGKMSSVKNVKYDKTITLPKNKFKKKGYVFACWNTKIDGSGKAYTNGQKVKGLTKKNKGTVNLYAIWSLKNAPDMSEYVKKSDVQKIVDAAVTQAVADAVKDIKNSAGRGIKSTALDKDGNLIVTYTDGEKVNVGVVKGPKGDKGEDGSPDGPKEDFQRVGYVVPITQTFPLIPTSGSDVMIKITDVRIKLAQYDPGYARKYVYECEISYEADIKEAKGASTIQQGIGISRADIGRKGNYTINMMYLRLSNEVGKKTGVYTWTLNSEDPIKSISDLGVGGFGMDNNPVEQQ